MITRRSSILFVILAFVTVAALLAPFAPVAGGDESHLRLDGTWIGKDSGGVVGVVSFIPTDPNNNSGSFTVSVLNFDGTLGGIFPDVSLLQNTLVRGDILRTGPRTFDFFFVGYGRSETREIVSIVVVEGAVELLDADNYVHTAVAQFFSAREQVSPIFGPLPDQDADDDGLPDAGEEPILALPQEFVAKRLAAALR